MSVFTQITLLAAPLEARKRVECGRLSLFQSAHKRTANMALSPVTNAQEYRPTSTVWEITLAKNKGLAHTLRSTHKEHQALTRQSIYNNHTGNNSLLHLLQNGANMPSQSARRPLRLRTGVGRKAIGQPNVRALNRWMELHN